jgi:threonylcarbamoyladenosine tRNA methylthiotransferase MtaB
LIALEGDYRLRISSIEPNLLTDEILTLTKNSNKLTKHFHIPLQSGSAKILKLMQRRYTKEYYFDLIHKVKSEIPNVGIGVDVIVGFPGEGEEEFLETYNFLKELPISYLHVFTYSERPDTKAITMEGQVPINIRRKRNNMLRILSEKKRHEFYESLIGKKVEVLFENDNVNGMMKGFSSNYVRIVHEYDETLINKFTEVLINKTSDPFAKGEIIGQKYSVDTVNV